MNEQNSEATAENTAAVEKLTQTLATAPSGQPAPDELAKRAAFYRQMVPLCRKAIGETKHRRPYILVEVKGERAGGWVEVYPGVKGQPVAFGRRTMRDAAGAVVELRLTRVKVCARTMLAAMEHGVKALPPELQAELAAPQAG